MIPKIFTIYDLSSGEILKNVTTIDEDITSQLADGESYIDAQSNDILQYVLDGVIADKSISPAIIDKNDIVADGVDIATISNLPNPSTISIRILGISYVVSDGSFGFTIDTPGSYTIRCDGGCQYLEKEFVINAS